MTGVSLGTFGCTLSSSVSFFRLRKKCIFPKETPLWNPLLEFKKESKQLKAVNNKLTREKLINESIAHLAKDKQDMIKNLVKDVPTEQLNESIKKYIPMILSNSSAKTINKSERVLKESRKPTILTGENKNKVAMNLDDDMGGLDVDAEISRVIENGKFNF